MAAGAPVFDPVLAERGDATQVPFASAAFEQLPPCTATSESTCQIVDHLSTLNELLFHAELELRELSAPYGQLSLASLAEMNPDIPRDSQQTVNQAVALVHRLLKTHSCVLHVHIHHRVFAFHEALICDALKCNPSTRLLSIDFRAYAITQDLDDVFCSLKHLQELECLSHGVRDDVSSALPTVVRVCKSLTTLKIAELCMTGRTAKPFVAALKGASTLKELSVHGSVICEAGRGQFAQYLRDTTSLTTLSVAADELSRRNCFNWMAEGLLVNKTIKKVRLNNVLFDQENAEWAGRIFTGNAVIRSFSVVYLPPVLSLQPSTDYNFWYAPLSTNETLEELSLPFSIWNSAQWVDFFWTASRKPSLKKLIISVHATDHRNLRDLCKALKESGAEDKVSLGTYFVYHDWDLMYSKAFSDVDMFCFDNVLARLSSVLLTFTHITSVRFSIRMGDVALVSAIAAYIGAATSLRKLRLALYSDDGDTEHDMNTSWTEIVEALARNTSIKGLCVHVDIDSDDSDEEDGVGDVLEQHQVQRLAQVIGSRQNIRTVYFGAEQAGVVGAFLRCFSKDIADNYNLVRVTLNGVLDTESAQDGFKVRDTARRNCGLVTRATQFARGRALDRHCAIALERVWRHAALVEELAEQLSVSVEEASATVRRGLRSMEGLHDFMRLARVVRDGVVCDPSRDGGPRLDALNDDCWRLVRRYLMLGDVREPAEPASSRQ
ncbi:uncharacterized protein LOC119432967 isoform X2 [Dermacentor silvarum]|uniref:uncharacterized protein LOC119432967 isoform X2 n=1 Tax=Dermacentor silvarum TaxID=543639 RepID=UPI002100B077|nr:uncharacterized protein LOC119432967 isoform X2 [Dermacentor silvarum]